MRRFTHLSYQSHLLLHWAASLIINSCWKKLLKRTLITSSHLSCEFSRRPQSFQSDFRRDNHWILIFVRRNYSFTASYSKHSITYLVKYTLWYYTISLANFPHSSADLSLIGQVEIIHGCYFFKHLIVQINPLLNSLFHFNSILTFKCYFINWRFCIQYENLKCAIENLLKIIFFKTFFPSVLALLDLYKHLGKAVK